MVNMNTIIKDAISSSPNKMISFAQFMELALYHPNYGYYMREQTKIGKKGDFITSSNISNVFAVLFTNIFIDLVEQQKVSPTIVEIGGGSGRFAKSVLEEWKERSPQTYEQLTYILIETSPYHRELQRQLLINEQDKVIQFEHLQQFIENHPFYQGIVFTNELFDAFPVEVIEKRNEELHEVMVTLNDNNEIEEYFVPLSNKEIIKYLEEQNIELTNGQRFEIPLQMKSFIHELSSTLEQAVVYTVDYGYTHKEWQHPAHMRGSLRGYHRHQLINNPLLNPGNMDITSHVHLDAVKYYYRKAGFTEVAMLRQDQFLLEAGILQYLQDNNDTNPFSEVSKRNRAIRSLILDGGISSYFHVIMMQKNMDIAWEKNYMC
ncbi:class I SAM-dependent methyltransferase [Bacillus sp. SCS-151]|uniref:class I SAM-dependent methyltransferase n=1 Tax=Nanhaiella sioensis TaxID=3115293 RepID=UPI00397DD642